MNLVHAALPLLLVFGNACQSAGSEPELQSPSEEEQAEAPTWTVRGEIKRIERDRKMMSVAHEEVPGYMPAMTMPFWMDSDALFEGLAVGDSIEFRFRRGEGGKHFVVSVTKL
jgi:Cu(I)/Ag(I) efflux system periplasmic protein CusF